MFDHQAEFAGAGYRAKHHIDIRQGDASARLHNQTLQLLLSLVADFFARIYEKLDVAMFDAFVERGDLALAQQMAHQWDLDPTRLHLVQVALEEVGPAVRELAITSFLRTQSKHGAQDEQLRQVIATYHVAGRMALLEQCLRGDLDISYEATKMVAWIFLRALIVDVRDHDWLRSILLKD